MKLDCTRCESWSRGCALTVAASIVRHGGGEPGDERTVQDWRNSHGIRAGEGGLPTAEVEPRVRCPGLRAIRGRR